MEIRVWDFKITGIAGIHATPINLKSLHSDFPVKSLEFPVNICSVVMIKCSLQKKVIHISFEVEKRIQASSNFSE